MLICEYHNCKNPQHPNQPKTGIKLCREHDAEFDKIVNSEPFNPQKLFKFWVDCHGGPEKWAEEMTQGFVESLTDDEIMSLDTEV